MTRRLLLITACSLSLIFALGCPKKKPAAPAEEIQMETKAIEPPPAKPTQELPARPDTTAADEREVNPLESEDLRVVNSEARRQGFTPNIYFDYNKSDLKPEVVEALSRNAEFLRGNPRFTVTIEGHCDERGTNEYNLALGERRANAAKSYLASLGVTSDRMVTTSYGEERPVCTVSEESCWSQNRRAFLVITGRR